MALAEQDRRQQPARGAAGQAGAVARLRRQTGGRAGRRARSLRPLLRQRRPAGRDARLRREAAGRLHRRMSDDAIQSAERHREWIRSWPARSGSGERRSPGSPFVPRRADGHFTGRPRPPCRRRRLPPRSRPRRGHRRGSWVLLASDSACSSGPRSGGARRDTPRDPLRSHPSIHPCPSPPPD